MHIVYPSRRNLASRTRIGMDILIERTRAITPARAGRGIADLRLLLRADLRLPRWDDLDLS
jgi:hypothetical protein